MGIGGIGIDVGNVSYKRTSVGERTMGLDMQKAEFAPRRMRLDVTEAAEGVFSVAIYAEDENFTLEGIAAVELGEEVARIVNAINKAQSDGKFEKSRKAAQLDFNYGAMSLRRF